MSYRESEQKNLRYRSGKGILVFSLLLLVGLLLALVAMLPQFYINRIEIKGERRLKASELISSSGIESGKHMLLYVSGGPSEILRLRYGDIEKKLCEEYPYLESVEVKADFPYKVSINVHERVEVGYLETPKDYVAVDSRGVILERLPLDTELNAPVFVGITIPDLSPGETIPEDSQKAVTRTVLVINAVLRADLAAADQFSLISRIKSYYPYSANTLYLETEDLNGKALTVRLNPSDNAEQKISWFRNAMIQGALDHLNGGILDLSGNQNVYSPSQTLPPVPTYPSQETELTGLGTESSQSLPPSAAEESGVPETSVAPSASLPAGGESLPAETSAPAETEAG